MGERRTREERRRAREFEAFVAGAAGRLQHAATLLTGEPFGAAPLAQELLVGALSRTYADWDRLRGGDPYEHTRRDLAGRFSRTARRYRRPLGGLLDRLAPQERLMLVLRLYEGVAEEQIAASLGLPVERVRALCTRGMAAVLSGGAGGPLTGARGGDAGRDGPGTGGRGDGGPGGGGRGDGGPESGAPGDPGRPVDPAPEAAGPKAASSAEGPPRPGIPKGGDPGDGPTGASSAVVSRLVTGVRHTGTAVSRTLAHPRRTCPVVALPGTEGTA